MRRYKLSTEANSAIAAAAAVLQTRLTLEATQATEVARAALEAALPYLVMLAAPHRFTEPTALRAVLQAVLDEAGPHPEDTLSNALLTQIRDILE
jgi:predicted DNA-binding transcriptional regulator YafY